ncbi:hypothetical protein SAMN04488002_1057 [Litoreibacter janthinus]|uniref:Uncharacterized protein n=1 Tax=Litoreibacter janthinus TaxID=670154 RepID=A0A1I6G8U3_9RHOB|nr:hypothetical protein SAMN04488002_1057 [Litoreibacter janthinus]
MSGARYAQRKSGNRAQAHSKGAPVHVTTRMPLNYLTMLLLVTGACLALKCL